MSRIIIENRTNLTDIQTIELVHTVISHGRISREGKSYCLGMTFEIDKEKYNVWSDQNKCSDKFIITNK